MKSPLAEVPQLLAALHPLSSPPCGPGWNRAELDDLPLPECGRCEAAVLVGLVAREAGPQVLLTRRTEALRLHSGQVSFPGGRIEPDDADAIAAAVRETGEEVGVPPEQITPLGFLDPLATVSGFRVLPVVALLDPRYVARPDPGEVAAAFEVPLDFLLEPANLSLRTIDYRGRARQVAEFARHGDSEQCIWGATASILLNLRRRLADAAG